MAGLDVRDLAAEFGTPVFLLDEADFRSRARGYAEAFAGADVFYAGKAFLCGAVARWVDEEGLHLDVCSGGELAVALRAGFPAERIALHGNNKSVAELEMALDAGVGRIVARLLRRDRAPGRPGPRSAACAARVLIRVTVGVEAHTHEFIATAHEDQKFGFSLAGGAAAEAVRRVLMLPSLELVGLHSHIGSQIFDTDGFEVAAARLVGLAHGDPRRARRRTPRARPRRRARHRLHLRRRPGRRRPDGQVADRDRRAEPAPAPGWPCRGCRSSPAARSPAPARSPSTRSAPSSR